jgi:Protein of unknown function (DUF3606)
MKSSTRLINPEEPDMLVDKERAPSDTSQINLGEDWEVQWWCTKFGCTEVALRSAVRRVGPTAAAVEAELKEAARQAFKNTGED